MGCTLSSDTPASQRESERRRIYNPYAEKVDQEHSTKRKALKEEKYQQCYSNEETKPPTNDATMETPTIHVFSFDVYSSDDDDGPSSTLIPLQHAADSLTCAPPGYVNDTTSPLVSVSKVGSSVSSPIRAQLGSSKMTLASLEILPFQKSPITSSLKQSTLHQHQGESGSLFVSDISPRGSLDGSPTISRTHSERRPTPEVSVTFVETLETKKSASVLNRRTTCGISDDPWDSSYSDDDDVPITGLGQRSRRKTLSYSCDSSASINATFDDNHPSNQVIGYLKEDPTGPTTYGEQKARSKSKYSVPAAISNNKPAAVTKRASKVRRQ